MQNIIYYFISFFEGKPQKPQKFQNLEKGDMVLDFYVFNPLRPCVPLEEHNIDLEPYIQDMTCI